MIKKVKVGSHMVSSLKDGNLVAPPEEEIEKFKKECEAASRAHLGENIEMVKFFGPLFQQIYENPVDEICDSGQIPPSEPVEAGFRRTIEMADSVLGEVDPKLLNKYTELQQSGGFKLNLQNQNLAASKGLVHINVANNPASLCPIAHEVAHLLTPNVTHSPFRETGAITAEILTAESLKNHGVQSNDTAWRMALLNKGARGITMANCVIKMAEACGFDLEGGFDVPMDQIVEAYRGLPDAEVGLLATVSEIQEGFRQNHIKNSFKRAKEAGKDYNPEESDREFDEMQGHAIFGDVVDMINYPYQIGTVLGIVLSKRIKNGQMSFEDVCKNIDDEKTPFVERVKNLGINEITPEVSAEVYKFANKKVGQWRETTQADTKSV